MDPISHYHDINGPNTISTPAGLNGPHESHMNSTFFGVKKRLHRAISHSCSSLL